MTNEEHSMPCRLSALLKDNQLGCRNKEPFSIRFRGVAEGFYGHPWSHAARLRQLKFYGEKQDEHVYLRT